MEDGYFRSIYLSLPVPGKIYTIVIICLFSEIRLQVIDYLILNLENHLQR